MSSSLFSLEEQLNMTLKRLLKCGQERGFFATPGSVFDPLEWDGLGVALWDAMSNGSQEAKGLSTA